MTPYLDQKLQKLGIKPFYEEAGYLPPSEQELQTIESHFGQSLPADYRDFVLRFGWYCFSPRIVVVRSRNAPTYREHSGNSEYLFDFGNFHDHDDPPEKDGLLWHLECLDSRMPPNMLPIASDLSSEYLLGVTGSDQGKVFYWDYNNEPDEDDFIEEGLPVPDNFYYLNLTLVAESFSELIERMRFDPRFFDDTGNPTEKAVP